MTINSNKAFFEYYERIGKSFSNRNRLEILSILMQSKKTVEELAEETNLSVANTSKHLQILLKSHLVKNKRVKNFIYYEIFNQKVMNLLSIFFKTANEQIEKQEIVNSLFLNDDLTSEKILSIEELDQKMNSQEIILLDVRPHEEYVTAHIPGAISMPIEELANTMKKLPDNKLVVAYCRGPHCVMSTDAIALLEQSGRQAVRLTESVSDWKLFEKEKTK